MAENAKLEECGERRDRARDSKRERERGTETGQNCIDRIKRRTGGKASVILVDLLKKNQKDKVSLKTEPTEVSPVKIIENGYM